MSKTLRTWNALPKLPARPHLSRPQPSQGTDLRAAAPASATCSATKAALHSYTQSLRDKLAGQIAVIEIVPPGVRTELTPGQYNAEAYMPLDDFIAETMAQLAAEPTPPEVLTSAVERLRFAKRDGQMEPMMGMLAKAN